MKVIAPDSAPVLEVDALAGARVAEDVPILAERTGEYRLEAVCGALRPSRAFAAQIVTRRMARAEDERRWNAARLYARGKAVGGNLPLQSSLWDEAERLWAALGETEKAAEADLKLGMALATGGRRAEAVGRLEAAARRFLSVGERQLAGAAFHRLGQLARDRGSWTEAREDLDRAAANFSKSGLFSAWIQVRIDQGLLLQSRGEGESALALLNDALDRARRHKEASDLVPALNALGRTELGLGDTETALSRHFEALKALGPPRTAERELLATTMQHVGAGLRALHDRHRAARYLRWAARLAHGAGLREVEGNALNDLGLLYYEGERYRESKLAIEQAVELYARSGNQLFEGQARANLAWIETLLRNPRGAEDQVRRAESLLGPSGLPLLVSFLHLIRAEVLRQDGRDPDRALEESEMAMDGVERARSRIARLDLRRNFAPGVQAFYESSIRLLMERNRREPNEGWDGKALVMSERARARTILDLLEGEPSIPSITIAGIQRDLLDRDSILLAYSLGAEKSYLWSVTPDAVRSFELPRRRDLVARIRPVVAGMARSDRLPDLKKLGGQALSLSRALVGPVGRISPGLRLILVVPPEMQSIPFAALPDPFVHPARQGDRAWPTSLGEGHQLVEEPSLAALAVSRARRSASAPPIDRVTLVAAAEYGRTGQKPTVELSCGVGSSRVAIGSYPPLRFSPKEAAAITNTAGPSKVRRFLGAEANVEAMLAAGLERERFLHFSVHSYLDWDEPDRSALVLSAFGPHGEPLDPCFTAGRIAKLRLSASLVVLSACSTGLGREVAGEGLVGLGQAFLAAGAARVLVTLWDVQDQPTSRFMDLFYRKLLKEGLEPSEALRRTQREIARSETASGPSYWGGFLLLGDWK